VTVRVVIDTNVVVSAILRDRVPEDVILFVVEEPEFEWVASTEIVAEYVNVLKRPKFGLPEAIVSRWQALFAQYITPVEAQDDVVFLRDRKDEPFLACALSAGAAYLMTGDKDFVEAYKVVNTTVLSVRQFKDLICDAW